MLSKLLIFWTIYSKKEAIGKTASGIFVKFNDKKKFLCVDNLKSNENFQGMNTQLT
jgi:hypothetical protein